MSDSLPNPHDQNDSDSSGRRDISNDTRFIFTTAQLITIALSCFALIGSIGTLVATLWSVRDSVDELKADMKTLKTNFASPELSDIMSGSQRREFVHFDGRLKEIEDWMKATQNRSRNDSH